MNIEQAIQNLRSISGVLDKCANRPENIQTKWAEHLEQMAWEMNRHANGLKELNYMFDLQSQISL